MKIIEDVVPMKIAMPIIIAALTVLILSACAIRNPQAKLLSGNLLTVNKNPVKTTQTAAASSTPTTPAGTDTPVLAEESKNKVIGHSCTKLDQIPLEWIEKAKADLHIIYGHTSHGSLIISGLTGLYKFKKSPYDYGKGVQDSLDLRDNPFGEKLDLGQPDNKRWMEKTRSYLKSNDDINVVMWSWCGQLSKANSRYVKNYLDLMQALEKDFPDVTFVYMTGHLDGTGESGTLQKNNDQIRTFCISNNKVLYDFADIESYNPDGDYFGDKRANDACDYDSNGDKKPDKNWAKEWQDSHKEGTDWFPCSAAHSQPVNANMKAYAAWWLMARLAGWDGNPQPNAD
jgi:hypothetical protein